MEGQDDCQHLKSVFKTNRINGVNRNEGNNFN